jgi:Uma2 family endonuclease
MSMAVVIDSDHRQDHRHWTAADLREIPDDRNRYEIIDGELFVTPAPSLRHQELSASFFITIRPYLKAHGIGNIIYAPADVVLADDTVLEPDLFVFPPIEGKLPARWEGAAGLLLVIEVLSPGTARTDRTIKRRRYQREGIPECWIVDGDARVVERWRPEDDRPEIISELLDWRPDSEHPALTIELPALFAAALGD